MPPAELVEIRRIAESCGLDVSEFYGYPPSFEAYLIQMRLRARLTRLRTEVAYHEDMLAERVAA